MKRRAAEAIVRQGLTPGKPSFAPVADIYALLKDPDRFVRYSGRIALEHTPRGEWMPLVMKETALVPLTEGLLALTNTAPPQSDADLAPIFEKVVGLMKRPNLTPEEKIRVLRTFEVAATETRSGVAPGDPKAGPRRPDRPDADRRARRHLDRVHEQDRTGDLQRGPAHAPSGQGARLHRRARRDRQDPRADAQGQRRPARPDRLHVLAPGDRRGLDARPRSSR